MAISTTLVCTHNVSLNLLHGTPAQNMAMTRASVKKNLRRRYTTCTFAHYQTLSHSNSNFQHDILRIVSSSSLDNVNAEMLLDQPMVQQDQPQKRQTQIVNNRSRQLNNEHNNQNAHTNANNSHIRTQLQTRQHRWRREEMKLPVQVPAQSPCQQVLRVMILAFMFSPQ